MAELVVGVPHRGPSVVTLPFDLAASSLLLADAGVQVRVVQGSYAELSSWLAAGRIALCRRGPDVDVVAAVRGAPVASCAAVMQAVPGQVVATGDISEPADLEGRVIGVIDPAMGSTLALQAWLRREGVDLDLVRFEVIGSTRRRLAALASGTISATFLTAPAFFDLADHLHPLADLDEALGPFLFSAVQVHVPTAETRRAEIAAFLAAVMDAIDMLTGAADVTGTVAEVLGVEAVVAAAVVERARRLDWYPPGMAFSPAAASAMVAALADGGHVPADLPKGSWRWDEARQDAAGRAETP